MSSAVVECVKHLIEEYRRFLRSTYRLADPKLREQFEEHIDQSDVVVKGPYVTLARDYAQGGALADLVADGVGHKDLLRLKWKFGDKALFKHQENAFRRVDYLNRCCVIKTGTGSGKTEAFLMPVISGVRRLREQGVRGTKAILLYPMNALVNDQLIRMRELLRGSGVDITFAMYTGDSESVALTLGEPVEGMELISRSDIRANPPDIILTNYKELEFMLVRNVDRPLFGPALRYLVLDEIHSYRGALATEIACLIRRIKARCRLKPGDLKCIGTSATVSEGAGGDEALAEFVSDLFGEQFDIQDIEGEIPSPRDEPSHTYMPPLAKIDPEDLEKFSCDDIEKVLGLTQRITGKEIPKEGTLTQKVSSMLEGNKLVSVLEEACLEPASIDEIAEKIAQQFPEAKQLGKEATGTLVEAYVLVGSIGSEDDPPLLRPKLHTFFHGVYDVGLCLNPGCRLLVRNGSEECPRCRSAVMPAALCRTCGQDFAKVRFPDSPGLPPVGNDSFESDEYTGFITPRIHVEREAEEDEGDEPPKPVGKRKQSAARARLEDVWVCFSCGMVHDEETASCSNCGEDTVTPQKLLKGKGNTCPACNSTYTRGDILTLLRSGVASTNSLLATHHLDLLSGEDRKLLVFSDNRQEAAYQAGYMGDRHRQFAVRHAIHDIVVDSGNKGCALMDIREKVLDKFQEMGFARRRLTSDEKEKWLHTLNFEIASEFCRATHQRISLENLALVEVQYEFLDGLADEKEFAKACEESSVSIEDGLVLVRAILDRIRRTRAVNFPFFQRYLDPSKDPWSMLQNEPYNLTVPEYERNPTFYMLDRNEGARNKPSGFQFSPLAKDSPRGGSGAISKILRKAGFSDTDADRWIRTVIKLLRDRLEILVPPEHLPPRVRRTIGTGKPFQLASRVIRVVPASRGYRCERCRIWHPYRGAFCFTTRCSGESGDLKETEADRESYYVRLYTSQAPRRMLAAEHTAQIAQEQRAKRETDFKKGRLDILVCSPTLELGVDIGPLLTVLLRNCPPTPANYIQRAGRAGRRIRVGFVSTFCGMGAHDRHCFEEPEWLVRGEFHPPFVRLDNSLILARHVRSFVLENLQAEFPGLMGHLVTDLDKPEKLDLSPVEPLFAEIEQKKDSLLAAAIGTFAAKNEEEVEFLREVIDKMSDESRRIFENWHELIRRIFQEHQIYSKITADRQAKQKAKARERAYWELTRDRRSALVLSYLANEGLLPSYQFPTDTFLLEPGVPDTPTLRRPAWIALFEFAPGNMIYVNGHKLKTIRALFEGRSRMAGMAGDGSMESSGRVKQFCFCDSCGFAAEDMKNDCPACGKPISTVENLAFIESFEAEQFTQITSAEEARQRTYFERKERLVPEKEDEVEIYAYPFSQIELCRRSKILVSNWGKRGSTAHGGEKFELCPSCGRHRPSSLTESRRRKWDQDHARFCSGHVASYVLGYEFHADALVLPIPGSLIPPDEKPSFARTLGAALRAGAVELMEMEPDEVAFFYHDAPGEGLEIVFYETAPGGAGYLHSAAGRLSDWAQTSMSRLFNHDCAKACYKCLKTYRNQPFHQSLDKNLVRDVLFQLSCSEMLGPPVVARRNDGIKRSNEWTEKNAPTPTKNTVIERKLLEAILEKGRLPKPAGQKEFKSEEGRLITVADFAYEDEKIAIYCDGFAYHGSKEKLATDAQKRNAIQAQGWAVLTFWGNTILKYPDRCEEEIWMVYAARKGA